MPGAIHPDAEDIDARTLAWAFGHGIPESARHRARLEAVRPGLLTARVVPDGSREPLQVFTDFHTWLFAFDDDHCDEGAGDRWTADGWAAHLARMGRVAETGDPALLTGDPYARALADVSRRLRGCASDAQRASWARAVRDYFAALLWERVQRSAGPFTGGLDEYVLLRLRNGAMQASIALLDVASGYEVDSDDRQSPRVRALVEMTAVLVSWDNDLFSRHKENAGGSGAANLVDVLASDPRVGPRAAVDEAVGLRNQVMALFLEVRGLVEHDAGPELRRFLAALGRWVRANLDFSAASERYADPARTWDGEPDWNAVPSSGTPERAPAAVLAWWWTLRHDGLDRVPAAPVPA
ncbi:terpene synthase [Streptomyces sp. NPDC035033]|uniref:terpene synthase family protein n=1 Tax=Streptomyces sp. NPDC035033 TaxID=3155368 RepID=UPI0033F0436D